MPESAIRDHAAARGMVAEDRYTLYARSKWLFCWVLVRFRHSLAGLCLNRYPPGGLTTVAFRRAGQFGHSSGSS